MGRVVAFTGPSNSGKTTIIEKLAKILIEQNRKVVIIKHDPKDKAVFDVEGKDSYKFSQTGADVFVLSPTRTTYFSKKPSSIDRVIEISKPFDYLLIEGLKTLPIPRIGIFRNSIEMDYIEYISAIATDIEDIERYQIPEEIEILNLNSPLDILKWIDKNSKEV
ncbi:MAG TPA: molybdopterin-guanine dinucleotide biosynthesis protein B [Campylobacterales bacterium]|nr:molybdopterin-guanine dinucleotide biosynthesis protein B [Campylobacterales bacterium]HIO70982.1 molybdopterin-guanine dinucleotide biosynthesis protein B [Campylobacterales bacterium]